MGKDLIMVYKNGMCIMKAFSLQNKSTIMKTICNLMKNENALSCNLTMHTMANCDSERKFSFRSLLITDLIICSLE